MAKERGRAKVHKVMGEFKRGTLHSGSGGKVSSRKQAVAIAMSEAGLSRKRGGRGRKHTGKGGRGGYVRNVRSA